MKKTEEVIILGIILGSFIAALLYCIYRFYIALQTLKAAPLELIGIFIFGTLTIFVTIALYMEIQEWRDKGTTSL